MSFINTSENRGPLPDGRGGAKTPVEFSIQSGTSPVLEFMLNGGESVVCDASAIMYFQAGLRVTATDDEGTGRWRVTNPEGEKPARLILTVAGSGQVGVFDLARHGGQMLTPVHNLVAYSDGVRAATHTTYRDLCDGLSMSLVLLKGKGWAFLRGYGKVTETKLAPGEQAGVNALSIAAMSATVDFDPIRGLAAVYAPLAKVTGPGTVWLQSDSSIVQSRMAAAAGQMSPSSEADAMTLPRIPGLGERPHLS